MHVPFESYVAFFQCNVSLRLTRNGILNALWYAPSQVLYPKVIQPPERIFLKSKFTNHPCWPTRSDAKYFSPVQANLAEMWVQHQDNEHRNSFIIYFETNASQRERDVRRYLENICGIFPA